MTFDEIITYWTIKGCVSKAHTEPGCKGIKIKLSSKKSAFISYATHKGILSPFKISVCYDDDRFFIKEFTCEIKENIPGILEMYIK